MEHDDAIRFQAAERYVAGELPPAERDAFEEHFFDCRECAEEVRWEQIFAANARALSRDHAAVRPAKWWEAWLERLRIQPALALSLAANFALAIGFAYLMTVAIGGGGGPRFVPAFFAPGPARAAQEAKAIPAGAPAFAVHFPAPDRPSSSYFYEIIGAQGTREAANSLKASAGEGDLWLEVPVHHLPQGVHTLIVRGDPASEVIARFRFLTTR
jgi:anti-sigma factor RsiW